MAIPDISRCRLPIPILLVLAATAAAVAAGCGEEPSDRTSASKGPERPLKDKTTGQVTEELMPTGTHRVAAARELGYRKAGAQEARLFLRKYSRKADNPDLREACIWALGAIRDNEAATPLRWAVKDTDPDVRIAAIRALGKLPRNQENTEAIVRGMADEEPDVRLAAVEVLGDIPGQTAAEALSKALSDPHPDVSAMAAKAARGGQMVPNLSKGMAEAKTARARLAIVAVLRRTGSPDTVAPLLAVLHKLHKQAQPRRDEIRDAVVNALVPIGEEALGPIQREVLLGELDPLAEQAAAEVCVRLGKPAAKTISDGILAWKIFPDPDELAMWIRALGRIGSPAARPALERALAQAIPAVNQAVADAKTAIEKTSGESLGDLAPDHDLLTGPVVAEAVRLRRDGPPALVPIDMTDALPDDGVVRVTLKGGLRGARTDLELLFHRKDGTWQEHVIGEAARFNKRTHDGRLVRHTDGETIELVADMIFHDDYWVTGGIGEYTVRLTRGDSGWTGGYVGHFNFEDVSGTADVQAWKRPWYDAEARPLTEGDHPRLLFRPEDLPVLRARARTKLGREILTVLRRKLAANKTLYREKVDWVRTWAPGAQSAIGHAFLGLLADEERHGRRAALLAVDRTTIQPYGGEHGERLPDPQYLFSFTYDLAYPFMTPEEHDGAGPADLGADDVMRLKYLYWAPARGPQGVIAVTRGVFPIPGLHALAVLGEKASFAWQPPEEPSPIVDFDAVEPPAEGADVPVNAPASGELLPNWLYLGPLSQDMAKTALAKLGGPTRIRPEKGDNVTLGKAPLQFVPVGTDEVTRTEILPDTFVEYIRLPGATKADLGYLYSVVSAEQKTSFTVRRKSSFGLAWNRLWIDGREVADGTIVSLAAGPHHVLIETIGETASPMFWETDATAARAARKRYDWLRKRWQAAKKRHEATGRIQVPSLVVDESRRSVLAHCRWRFWEESAEKRMRLGYMVIPYGYGHRVATGKPLLDNRTFLSTDEVRALAGSGVRGTDRYVCFGMGMTRGKRRTAFKEAFDARYLPDSLGKLAPLELVTAFVTYPFEETVAEETKSGE